VKIVYVVETFTEGLGYIDNVLPFEFAKKGHEVHLLTCRLPVYYQFSAGHFGRLLDKPQLASTDRRDGVTIHTLHFRNVGSRLLMVGLLRLLWNIRPDVVIVRGVASPVLIQVIAVKLILRFRLYTSTGQAYTAVPAEIRCGKWYSRPVVSNFFSRFLVGRACSFFVEKCIASLADGARACIEFYGISANKLIVIPLGVDTDIFFPATDATCQSERSNLRAKLGLSDEHVLCIWTGRMTIEKGVEILAQAVRELAEEGYPIVALFVGDGPAKDKLNGNKYALTHEFVAWKDLAQFYRAADVAVWPKSITTSSLDASASGLPVVMSSSEAASERWDRMGSSYEDGSVPSLKKILLKYMDPVERMAASTNAVKKMNECYSWTRIAQIYLNALCCG